MFLETTPFLQIKIFTLGCFLYLCFKCVGNRGGGGEGMFIYAGHLIEIKELGYPIDDIEERPFLTDVRQTLCGRKLGPPCPDIKAAKGKDPGECFNLTKQQ